MRSNDARHALLARLIDHAPMFPPASLGPTEALAADARARVSAHAFALGRLVWPASALDDVATSERQLSAVLDAPLPAGSRVAAVETRYRDNLGELADLAAEVYVEIPPDDALDDRLDEIRRLRLRAKVRCGGGAIPSAGDLARFVRGCRKRGVAFKATAGLHHAIRGNGEHGFLNLLAAVIFDGDEDAALLEADASAFALHASAFAWNGRSASPDELARVRSELLHSIGSCSFDEPVDALAALGMLPS